MKQLFRNYLNSPLFGVVPFETYLQIKGMK